ncbi:MAG: mechanosensitive ion channel domain-containing protein, partial [Candidatus Bipolaricaulota bacterium]
MGLLRRTFAENEVWVWLVALGIFLLTVGLLKLVKWVIHRRLTARYARTKSELVRLIGDLVRRTHLAFILVVALYAASLALTIPEAASKAMRTLAVLAWLMQFASWGNRLISFCVNREIRRKLEEEQDAASVTTLNAMAFLVKIVLWAVVLLLALDNMGINITALITGLGIAGIAVALALQNILGDLFASISIVVDKPFLVGDFIIVGDMLGTVERVGLKTTRVRSLTGEQVTL